MALLSSKYFVFRVFRQGRETPVVVWNGVRDYENSFLEAAIPELGEGGPSRKVHIVQIGKPVGDKRSIYKTVQALVDRGPVMLWARDQATYDSVIAEFKHPIMVTREDGRAKPLPS
jgi:hypothetical protein